MGDRYESDVVLKAILKDEELSKGADRIERRLKKLGNNQGLKKIVSSANTELEDFVGILKRAGAEGFMRTEMKDAISATKQIGVGKKLRITGSRTPEGAFWKTRESYSVDLDAPKKAKLKKEAEAEKTRIREKKEADKTRLRKQKDDEKVVRLAKREKEQKAKARQKQYEKEHGFTEVTRIGGEAVVTTGFFGKKGERNIKSMTKRLGGFRMEMLSVLFNMQGLNKTFTSLFSPALEASGVFEVFGAVMTAVMLPVLEPVITVFMWLMDVLLGLSEPVQFVIGLIIGLAAVITQLIATGASWILLFSGFGSMSAFIAEVVTVITGSIGILVGSIFAIIAIILLVYAAWTQNWFGIREKFASAVEWIKSGLGTLTGFLVKLRDLFFEKLGAITNFIREGFGKIVGWLKSVFDNPLVSIITAFDNFRYMIKEKFEALVTMAKDLATKLKDAVWNALPTWLQKAISGAVGVYAEVKTYGKNLIGGGFMSSPYTTTGGTVYEGIHQAQGLYDLNASRAGNNLTYAPVINITASISSDMDLRRIADRLDSMMQDRMRKYVRGT